MKYLLMFFAFTLLAISAVAKPHEIPFTVKAGLVYVEVTVNGEHVTFLVDSGSNFTSLKKTASTPAASRQIKINNATSNSPTNASVVEVSMALNGYYINHEVVYWSFSFPNADGVLGNDVLRKFGTVTFDYGRSVIVLGK